MNKKENKKLDLNVVSGGAHIRDMELKDQKISRSALGYVEKVSAKDLGYARPPLLANLEIAKDIFKKEMNKNS